MKIRLPYFILTRKGNRGFFLLESVVAIMVLGLASAGFLALYSAAGRNMVLAERHSVAASLAREKMEQVKSGGFWRAAAEDEPEVAGFPGYAREVRVAAVEGADDLRLWRVEVRVGWEEGGIPGEYRLASFLAAQVRP
jgi:type II secretory pathway pseudopilin PulG